MGTGRLEHLDGLRGLAALAVVIFHFQTNLAVPLLVHDGAGMASAADWAAGLLAFAHDGALAVAIFFVLSGIVLGAAVDGAVLRAVHPERRLESPTFVGLLAKRYLRLTLPVLASMVLGYIAFAHFWTGADYARLIALKGEADPDLSMTRCAACTAPALPDALLQGLNATLSFEIKFYNRVLWTMPWEMIGSLAVFLLVLAIRRPFWRRAITLILLYWIADGFVGSFLIGLLIHDLGLGRGWASSAASRHSMAALDAAGIAIAGLGLTWPALAAGIPALQPIVETIGSAFREIGWNAGAEWAPVLVQAAMIVVGCCLSPTLNRCLSAPAARFLGRVSFPLYLIHMPLMMILVFPSFVLLAEAGWGRNVLGLGFIAASLPLMLLAAHLFERFVERPAVKLAARGGRLIDARWNGARDCAAQATARLFRRHAA